MASGVMHNGLVRAGKAMGLSDEALDVGSWGMRGTMMGIKGAGLVYGFASGSSSTQTASAPSSNAFMTAAAGAA
jgi:hypothetical protein